jgi:hypothetical protein
VVTSSKVVCDFDIPAPPEGTTLDLSKVAVSYTSGDGSAATELGQAATPDDCQENAFYIENNHVYLCEEACTAINEGSHPMVDVLFKCESTIIPPR